MKWFEDEEFHCRCGRPECDAPKAPSRLLALYLDRMRDLYGGPLIVNSGNRCAVWNQQQGGVANSEHVRVRGCEGADLQCRSSRERWTMLDAARHAGFTRIGIGKTFLHVGCGTSEQDVEPVIWTYYP